MDRVIVFQKSPSGWAYAAMTFDDGFPRAENGTIEFETSLESIAKQFQSLPILLILPDDIAIEKELTVESKDPYHEILGSSISGREDLILCESQFEKVTIGAVLRQRDVEEIAAEFGSEQWRIIWISYSRLAREKAANLQEGSVATTDLNDFQKCAIEEQHFGNRSNLVVSNRRSFVQFGIINHAVRILALLMIFTGLALFGYNQLLTQRIQDLGHKTNLSRKVLTAIDSLRQLNYKLDEINEHLGKVVFNHSNFAALCDQLAVARPDGIEFTEIQFKPAESEFATKSSPDGRMELVLSGVSNSAAPLSQFLNQLEESNMFSDVDITDSDFNFRENRLEFNLKLSI